ncbi:MAG: putative ABC transport system permease protein [Glaciecola sp.]|jgi:putative ABC transport system permease protein
MWIPLSYALRGLWQRKLTTLLAVVGLGTVVAIIAGVLALQQGFERLYADSGRADLFVFLRPGANSEGESNFPRDKAQILMKSVAEIAKDESGKPMASMECFLAVRRFKVDGGETNVPIRGVQEMSFVVRGSDVEVREGKKFTPGSDEVIVGRGLLGRIRGCELGETVWINTTPFRVVGVLDSDGPFSSEIWGDFDRMSDALKRENPNRIIGTLAEGVDPNQFAKAMENHPEVPAKVQSEREYLTSQTRALSATLKFLAVLLGAIMGVAAVFTATNTMLSALAARTREVGTLLSIGFRPSAVFVSFLIESLILGLLGGLVGCLMVLPIHGIQTGTMNFDTFTEVAFAFRITPEVLTTSVSFALLLGLLGGAWPAWRACRLLPTEALRRH